MLRQTHLPGRMAPITLVTLGCFLVGTLFICLARDSWAQERIPADQGAQTLAQTINPFVDIVPSPDGTALMISARGLENISDPINVNVDAGPGHLKRSYTMVFSDTMQSHVARVEGFFPEVYAAAPIRFTTDGGLSSATVFLNRHYIDAAATPALSSVSGDLQVTIVNTDTFDAATYVTLVPGLGLPAQLPAGFKQVSSLYNVRASGDILNANHPVNMRLNYETERLVGRSALTLAVWSWEQTQEEWQELGGAVFEQDSYVTLATDRFTTFVLVATTTWRDEFDTFAGLDFSQVENVVVGGSGGESALVLQQTPGSGVAVSQPISATTGFEAWESLSYQKETAAGVTDVTVDILSADGTLLLSNVASGADLSEAIDAERYPALRLRANFVSSAAGEGPQLANWQINWRAAEVTPGWTLFLPTVSKQ